MGGANSEYYLFLKHDRRFLLAAKKKAGNKTSNYSVSRTKDRVSDKGAGCVLLAVRACHGCVCWDWLLCPLVECIFDVFLFLSSRSLTQIPRKSQVQFCGH